jgi:hypothetical protein
MRESCYYEAWLFTAFRALQIDFGQALQQGEHSSREKQNFREGVAQLGSMTRPALTPANARLASNDDEGV